jgi:hypothetical protein
MHFIGSLFVLFLITASLLSNNFVLLLGVPLVGYGFAWGGHFIFEKNKPATFSNPWYSLLGDWQMFLDILRGKIKL